jgi:FkbM family methyltransferase
MNFGLRQMIEDLGYFAVARGGALPARASRLFERFLDRSHLRQMLARFDINCVLDVGANVGDFAVKLRRIGYRGRIFSFEPDIHSFEIMTKRFRQDPLWSGCNYALGSANTTKPFNIAEFSPHSSFLTPRFGKAAKTREVPVRRLDSIFDDLISGITTPRVFLKIDAQGYDVEIVRGASGCIGDVLCLQSEISVRPFYDFMPHYIQALEFYESLGFQLLDLSPVCRNSEGAIEEYDCLMGRAEGSA